MNIDRTPGILAALDYLGFGSPLHCVDVSKCRFPKPKTSRIRSFIIALKLRFS
jgi:hypothetical protein